MNVGSGLIKQLGEWWHFSQTQVWGIGSILDLLNLRSLEEV
jgi:D-alanyl-D-alanine dipeptidase